MPRPPAEPGPRSLAVDAAVAFDLRLLSHEFAFSVPDAGVADSLRYLVQRAIQPGEPEVRVAIEVRTSDAGHEVLADGRPFGYAADPRGVLDLVYERVYQSVFDAASRAGWVRIHAALVMLGARRLLLSGPAGVGKTTLAVRLLYDGAAVHGDESVLLRDGVSVAVPRAFHLKAGVEQQIPELSPLLASLPTVEGTVAVSAFDPTSAGFQWEIAPGPVDAVVVMERADDVALERLGSTDLMHEVVQDVFLLHEPKSTVVREVAEIFRDAACYRLRLGAPREASALLRALAD